MQSFVGDNDSEALEIVQSLRPSQPYQIVSHGNDNLIILCDNDVFRFPRSASVWDRSSLEQFILNALRDHPDLSVPILKHVHENPAYTVSVALEGEILENEDISRLSHTEQYKIGQQIGSFAATFHQLFTPETIRPLLAEEHPQQWYSTYLDQILAQPGPHDDLARWLLQQWPYHDHSESTVIHDDLHVHNLLFDNAKNLSGVLDFGDVNLGNPEQDLRYTYWMGDEVIDGAIEAYELTSHRRLDRELIKLCAVSQELSGLYDKNRSYMHIRALKNLRHRHLI